MQVSVGRCTRQKADASELRKVATWNVQTLPHKGDNGEEQYVEKFCDWEPDFDKQDLDIITMQEIRVKGQYISREYKLYLAG